MTIDSTMRWRVFRRDGLEIRGSAVSGVDAQLAGGPVEQD
jgi:hypothetical protein